jgi:nitrogen regulatory protein PII
MKLVRAIVREEKTDDLVAALERAGVAGYTLLRACGRGRVPTTTVWRGREVATLRPMTALDVLIPDNQAEDIARLIVDGARTGCPGDGHVFVVDLDQSYAVRTGWMEDV